MLPGAVWQSTAQSGRAWRGERTLCLGMEASLLTLSPGSQGRGERDVGFNSGTPQQHKAVIISGHNELPQWDRNQSICSINCLAGLYLTNKATQSTVVVNRNLAYHK